MPFAVSTSFSFAWPLLDDVLHDRRGGERIRPTGIERKMAEHLSNFFGRQSVIHRPVQVISDLSDLSGRDESADRDQTAIARSEVRPQPKIPEQHVGRVLDEARRDLPELLSDARC